MIKCDETATVSEETIAALVRVWESSVRATHLFLSESEIERIKGYVPQALRQVRHLLVDSAGKVNGKVGIMRNRVQNHVFGMNASRKVINGAIAVSGTVTEDCIRFQTSTILSNLLNKNSNFNKFIQQSG